MAFCVETGAVAVPWAFALDSDGGNAKSPPVMRWNPGDQIVIREHWNGRIWTVRPVTVVEDTPEFTALYMMPGTTYKYPRSPDGSPVPHFLPDEWILTDRKWFGGGVLYLFLPGEWYALMGFFDDENRRIERWYLNLQTPFQRTRMGFDYLDQELDIVINRELTEWAWKDEELFEDVQRRGRISAGDAVRVRQEGERILGQLEAGSFKLPQKWLDWCPPESWEMPGVPESWQELEVGHSCEI